MRGRDNLIDDLKMIGCIKYAKPGEMWTLKSGKKSNVYIDLRLLPQHPEIFDDIVEQLCKKMWPLDYEKPYVAGLPVGGIPLATLYSQKTNLPMVLIRKTPKQHGTGQMVEIDYSDWTKPKKLILLDDVLTSGSTVIDTLDMIKEHNIPFEVIAVLTIVNREETPTGFVPGTTIPLISLLNMSQIVKNRRSFADRIKGGNVETQIIFHTMIKKRSNLCFSADIPDGPLLLEMLEKIADQVAIVKIHFDIVKNLDYDALYDIVEKNNIILMSDAKFCDIGGTIEKKLERHPKVFICTIHPFAGTGGILALSGKNIGSVLVAEMSNQDSLSKDETFNEWYGKRARQIALDMKNCGVCAFVCQSRSTCDAGDDYIYMTPGVHEDITGDSKGQRYRNCKQAIGEQKNDVVIVGSGIYKAENPVEAAEMYREAAWAALE